MKKLLLILLSALSLTAFAQEKKTITIQQPQCSNAMVANMVKSALTNAFARSDEWQPVAEMSLEQMMAAMDRTGNAAGSTAQYLLITAIQEMDGMCYISCKIMNLETGALDASAMEVSESSPQSIQQTCSALVKQLLEKQQ